MPKLIDKTEVKDTMPIGEPRLLAFIDEINAKRAAKGMHRRYKPMRNEQGVLTMVEHLEIQPRYDGHRPSPRYAEPQIARG